MKLLPFLALAAAVAIGQPAAALASPRVEKVYAANGRRVAVVKRTAFGTKVYGENGRRVATIKSTPFGRAVYGPNGRRIAVVRSR